MSADRRGAFGASVSAKFLSFASYVYAWVAAACGITALSAYLLYATGMFVFTVSIWWVFAFMIFGLSLFIRMRLDSMSSLTMSICLIAYSVLEGIFLGTILPFFIAEGNGNIVWVAFASACSMFLISILYGMYTKKDLTALGNLFTIGLFGLFAVSISVLVASMFWDVTFMHLLISYAGLVIFLGLTAFESQKIEEIGRSVVVNSENSYKLAMMVALSMYTNLITIFWYTLRILSSDRNR